MRPGLRYRSLGVSAQAVPNHVRGLDLGFDGVDVVWPVVGNRDDELFFRVGIGDYPGQRECIGKRCPVFFLGGKNRFLGEFRFDR
jgi:hypothetical protein